MIDLYRLEELLTQMLVYRPRTEMTPHLYEFNKVLGELFDLVTEARLEDIRDNGT